MSVGKIDTKSVGFCCGIKSMHLSLSSECDLGQDATPLMGSAGSILATAIDLLRKLFVNETQVQRQFCAQDEGPFLHGP